MASFLVYVEPEEAFPLLVFILIISEFPPKNKISFYFHLYTGIDSPLRFNFC